MRLNNLSLVVIYCFFSVSSVVVAEQPPLQPEEISRIFYDQALRASWACRIERVEKSPADQRDGQYAALTEIAFRYWVYSKDKIIKPDFRFENQLYEDFVASKNIPLKFVEMPIIGSRLKAIPGYKWSLNDFKNVTTEFKNFIINLKLQNIPSSRGYN